MASPVCLLKRARVGTLGGEHGEENMVELTRVLKKAQLVDRTFCSIKQLSILKPMDDKRGGKAVY